MQNVYRTTENEGKQKRKQANIFIFFLRKVYNMLINRFREIDKILTSIVDHCMLHAKWPSHRSENTHEGPNVPPPPPPHRNCQTLKAPTPSHTLTAVFHWALRSTAQKVVQHLATPYQEASQKDLWKTKLGSCFFTIIS